MLTFVTGIEGILVNEFTVTFYEDSIPLKRTYKQVGEWIYKECYSALHSNIGTWRDADKTMLLLDYNEFVSIKLKSFYSRSKGFNKILKDIDEAHSINNNIIKGLS